jgi:hypothetical protein
MAARRHLRRWGAVYLLLAFFLVSWAAQFWTQALAEQQDARRHGETFRYGDFLPKFLSTTFENWQSEWLQLIVQASVLLGMKHLIFKADAEDEERIETKLDLLLRERGIDVPSNDR